MFFPLLPSFVSCHLLTMSERASSGSIYTPHRTRLLQMPLFPIITFWHHTDMSRPQSMFRFPHSVLLGVIYESLDLCVCFVFAGKCGFCTKNKSCSSQKNTANDLHNKRQDKTKTGRGRHLHIFFLTRKVNEWWSRMMFKCWDVASYFSTLWGLKRNHCWSGRLAVALHCTCCSTPFESVLMTASETQEDGDFVICSAERWQTHTVHKENTSKQTQLYWSYCHVK